MRSSQKIDVKTILMFLIMAFPVSIFGADDDIAIPIKDLVVTWMKGNVGLTIAIVIVVLAAIGAPFGGGWGLFGKAVVFAIILGSCIFFAETVFNIGIGLGT